MDERVKRVLMIQFKWDMFYCATTSNAFIWITLTIVVYFHRAYIFMQLSDYICHSIFPIFYCAILCNAKRLHLSESIYDFLEQKCSFITLFHPIIRPRGFSKTCSHFSKRSLGGIAIGRIYRFLYFEFLNRIF